MILIVVVLFLVALVSVLLTLTLDITKLNQKAIELEYWGQQKKYWAEQVIICEKRLENLTKGIHEKST